MKIVLNFYEDTNEREYSYCYENSERMTYPPFTIQLPVSLDLPRISCQIDFFSQCIWYCQHEISNLFFTRLSISLNDLKPFFFSNLILNLKNMHFVAKVWEMGSIWTFFNVHSKFEFTFTKIWIRTTCFLLNLILLPFYFDKCWGPVYHIIKPSHNVSVFCVL